MIFLFLPFLAVSLGSPYITKLTSQNFESEIDKRSNLTVYMVMFHGAHCPACQMAYPQYQEAAEESQGMIKFGEVDTSVEYSLGSRFQIHSIPTFIIFHPKGQTMYNRERSARSFLNSASQFLPHLAQPVNEAWSEKPKAVILFSDKPTSPPLWAGISCAFSGTDIEIGFTNNQTLARRFGITAFPTIYMIDKEIKMVYNGKNKFALIRKGINDFFEGKLRPTPTPEPTPLPKLIHQLESAEEIQNECKGKGVFCVIEGGEKPSRAFEAAAQKYRHDRFRFYTCGEKCPLEYAKKGILILHHRRDAAIRSLEDELHANLDRVLDGGARFLPMAQVNEL